MSVKNKKAKGTVGQGEYTVKQGECLHSIADEHGFFVDTLWLLGENSELKAVRKSPDALLPGDKVHVPELRQKEESCGTGSSHKFKRKGIPAGLKVRFAEGDEPRDGESVVITVGSERHEKKLDGNGEVVIPVPPGAKKASVYFRDTEETVELSLGSLDPINETSGIRQRLSNLGYDCPDDDTAGDDIDQNLIDAIKTFQRKNDLEVTGDVDDTLLAKLEELHG